MTMAYPEGYATYTHFVTYKQVKMKKNIILLIMLWSCNNSELRNNDEAKTEIDRMPLTDCYFEIREDESGNIDTTRHIYEKRDKDDKLRYKLLKSILDGK